MTLEGAIYDPPIAVDDTIYICDRPGMYGVVPEPTSDPSPQVGGIAVILIETPHRAAPLASGNVIETLQPGAEVEILGG